MNNTHTYVEPKFAAQIYYLYYMSHMYIDFLVKLYWNNKKGNVLGKQ